MNDSIPRLSSISTKNVHDVWNHPNLEDLSHVEINDIHNQDCIDTEKSNDTQSSTSSVQSVGTPQRPFFHQSMSITQSICENCKNTHEVKNDNTNAISYKKMSGMLNDMYYNSVSEKSTALDIISIYLKGQKILYTEAKTYCEQILNSLMLPAILISAGSTVLSLQFSSYSYGGTVVSVLSAVNTFIIALISYLKLDAKSESHKIASYKFDKIQALCEFKSGKILLLDDKSSSLVNEILSEIESQVKDIKETNQFILPERIRYRFPVLYSTNVFSIVKKLRNDEIVLTNKLTTIVNKMIQLNNGEITEDIQIQLIELEKQQNEALEEIIHFRDSYLEIDNRFNKEIDAYIKKRNAKCNIFHWLKT